MARRYKIITNRLSGMTKAKLDARNKGYYMERGSDWEIPFKVRYNGKILFGNLQPNIRCLPIGLPGSFLVYSGKFFLGVILWIEKKGWHENGLGMFIDDDLVHALGEYIEIWYG